MKQFICNGKATQYVLGYRGECIVAVKADCDYCLSKTDLSVRLIHIRGGCASKKCSEKGHTV